MPSSTPAPRGVSQRRLSGLDSQDNCSPVDAARVEDVTTEYLGDASRYELAAFKLAVWEDQTDAAVPAWTALAVV